MTVDSARADLFDDGRDPFSPAMLQTAARGLGSNCEVVAEIVPTVGERRPLLQIVVVGTPRPQGSKKAFYNAKLGRALVVDDNDVRLRTWRQDVVTSTLKAMKLSSHERFAPHVAVELSITFMLPRPKSHWRTGRNAHLLRDDAPAWPTSKPDVDKLERATLDAMRDAGVYVDDSQVVAVNKRKLWATERPGAVIDVYVAGAPA